MSGLFHPIPASPQIEITKMNKPNWKKQGLPRYITSEERQKLRDKEELEAKIMKLPHELREMVRQKPWLAYGL